MHCASHSGKTLETLSAFPVPAFWEQFKYSSIHAHPEALIRLDNAGILVNSRRKFRGTSRRTTPCVVRGPFHDVIRGGLRRRHRPSFEYMHESTAPAARRAPSASPGHPPGNRGAGRGEGGAGDEEGGEGEGKYEDEQVGTQRDAGERGGPGSRCEQIGTRTSTEMQAGPVRGGGSGPGLGRLQGWGALVQAGRRGGSPWQDGGWDEREDLKVWRRHPAPPAPGAGAVRSPAAVPGSRPQVRRRWQRGVRREGRGCAGLHRRAPR